MSSSKSNLASTWAGRLNAAAERRRTNEARDEEFAALCVRFEVCSARQYLRMEPRNKDHYRLHVAKMALSAGGKWKQLDDLWVARLVASTLG